jgi:hypothetical protein
MSSIPTMMLMLMVVVVRSGRITQEDNDDGEEEEEEEEEEGLRKSNCSEIRRKSTNERDTSCATKAAQLVYDCERRLPGQRDRTAKHLID